MPQKDPKKIDNIPPTSAELAEVKKLIVENLRYTKQLAGSKSEQSDVKDQAELQHLLQENLKISKELYEMTSKIKKWVSWQRVWGVLKILIIVVPIILGILYLPPLIQNLIAPYRELMSGFGPSQQTDVKSMLDQFINNQDGSQINQPPVNQIPTASP